MSARDRYILIALVIVGGLGAIWFMALSPKRKEAAQLDKDIAAAQQQLDQSKQEKVTFAQAQLSFPQMYASLGRLGKAVPPDEDVPSLLVQLNHAAAEANVDFRSVELKVDEAAQAPAPTPPPPAEGGATPPAGATGASGATGATGADGTSISGSATIAPVEFQKLPFEYKFEGGFYNLEQLIHNVDGLVAQSNQELAISGRLITIEGFAMTSGKITVLATSYMLPADQGLFGGATPQAPAGTDPAAPQAASAGSATSAPPTAAVTAMNQLNAGIRTIFQDLVERRLWPVALVLVIMLIAIPVLLSNSGSESPGTPAAPVPTAPATGAGSSLPAFQPVVSTEGSKSSEIRKNLEGFESKDPFKVQGLTTGGSSAGRAARGVAGGPRPATAGDDDRHRHRHDGGHRIGHVRSGTSGSTGSTGPATAPARAAT